MKTPKPYITTTKAVVYSILDEYTAYAQPELVQNIIALKFNGYQEKLSVIRYYIHMYRYKHNRLTPNTLKRG